MENQIILLSNRGVRPHRHGATLFKNTITKSEQRLRCANIRPGSKKNKYRLSLVDSGEEQQYINHSVAQGNGNTWVFFIHGNNQTLDKNLQKCFALRSLYNVNVLAFSWPSVHYGRVRGLLNYIPRQPNIAAYATRQLRSKIRQYRKARINAKLSAKDLVTALQIAQQAFVSANSKANLICHSLGHYVLENTNELCALDELLSCYDNVLLHQADAENATHRNWVDAIGKGNSVTITTNEKDRVLKLSNFYNHLSQINQRMGNVKKATTNGSPIYKDFTGAKHVGFSGHSLFLTPAEKNPKVYAFFKPIIANAATN